MKKTIVIRDYEDKPTHIEIDDFENAVAIFCKILSGDEVITVVFKDGSTKEFDSSNDRIMGFYDGEYSIPLARIDEFNAMTNSYKKKELFE